MAWPTGCQVSPAAVAVRQSIPRAVEPRTVSKPGPDVSVHCLGFIFRHWPRKLLLPNIIFFSPCLLSGKHFLIFHVKTARLVVGGSICFLIDESPKVKWGIRILSSRLAVHEANGTSDLHDIDCAFGCARSTYVGRGFPCPISRGSVHGNCP